MLWSENFRTSSVEVVGVVTLLHRSRQTRFRRSAGIKSDACGTGSLVRGGVCAVYEGRVVKVRHRCGNVRPVPWMLDVSHRFLSA
jgi:hypothetical protein